MTQSCSEKIFNSMFYKAGGSCKGTISKKKGLCYRATFLIMISMNKKINIQSFAKYKCAMVKCGGMNKSKMSRLN